MEDTKSVWNSKQDIFKILQAFWTSGCRRSYCFVQRKSFSDNTYPRNTNVLASKFTNHVTRLDTSVIWQFLLSLTGVRKFHTAILDSSSSSWMIYCND